ncbi:MAG: hypothetical protein M3R24_05045 [Chloroflexota bacterium]|nr:hypothetical protein [Chloroflexota bacterium]
MIDLSRVRADRRPLKRKIVGGGRSNTLLQPPPLRLGKREYFSMLHTMQ